MTTKLQKWGNSQGIRIPKSICTTLKLSDNDELEISLVDEKIIVEKKQKQHRKTIEELFEGYDGDYVPEEFDWGPSVGEEIW
ncbi:MAG: AbrB/MazE/SpoVT family DNA-binding domain-containing protein [Oscillospiraceae bacterium]|nr:AbrB/MazE/SpoVT family DNA-binding domain-containing protein [Oscillospiraceae bacterium]